MDTYDSKTIAGAQAVRVGIAIAHHLLVQHSDKIIMLLKHPLHAPPHLPAASGGVNSRRQFPVTRCCCRWHQ